jgi:hypothetical protein
MKLVTTKSSSLSVIGLAVVALLLVLASTGGAVAGAMITGKQIKDGTITTRDVRDKTLTTTDLSPAAVKALSGRTGPQEPLDRPVRPDRKARPEVLG